MAGFVFGERAAVSGGHGVARLSRPLDETRPPGQGVAAPLLPPQRRLPLLLPRPQRCQRSRYHPPRPRSLPVYLVCLVYRVTRLLA